MRIFRIKNEITGLYYKGRAYSYNKQGKLYDKRTLKLAWKNVVSKQFPKEAYRHVIEEIRVEPLKEFSTTEIDNI